MNKTIKFIWPVCIVLLTGAIATAGETKSLTIRECIERALAGNLDIQIERVNPGIANWGIVQAQAAFEPKMTFAAGYADTKSPSSAESNLLNFEAGVSGALPTGTRYDLNASENRTGPPATNFWFDAGSTLTLTQPLLKNFGMDNNLTQIRIARKSRDIAGQQFVLRVINTISDVQNAYYELYYAIENHKALLEDLSRAKALLDENRKRQQVGVMSPLDVTQAEAGVAEREEAVIVAARVIQDNENVLKRLISRDVSEWMDVTFVPVDAPGIETVNLDMAQNTRTALEMRPDFVATRQELERRNILVKFNRNQLWPEVNLIGSLGYAGAGTSTARLGESWGSGDYPAWTVGVAVTVPLGNREARSSYNIAKLQSDQQVITLKKLEQDIIVGVNNAVRLVATNLKRVDATRVATRLAIESLKAEETKLRAGTSTSFLVLQAQAQLLAARSAEIRAQADYAESLVELSRTEGTTLRRWNIEAPPLK